MLSANAGGLLMLVREDFPQGRWLDLECFNCDLDRTECLVTGIIIQDAKWLMNSMYEQQIVRNNHY